MTKIAITNLDPKSVLTHFPNSTIVRFEPWGFSKDAIQKDLIRACKGIFDDVKQQEIEIIIWIEARFFGRRVNFVVDEIKKIFPDSRVINVQKTLAC